MSDYEIGDERVMRYVGVEFSEEKWIDNGELVRCESCLNWGARGYPYLFEYCPVLRKYTRPSDWCCWGARDEREEAR